MVQSRCLTDVHYPTLRSPMHAAHRNEDSRRNYSSQDPCVTISIPQQALDLALVLQGSVIARLVHGCILLGELYPELPHERPIEVIQVEKDILP